MQCCSTSLLPCGLHHVRCIDLKQHNCSRWTRVRVRMRVSTHMHRHLITLYTHTTLFSRTGPSGSRALINTHAPAGASNLPHQRPCAVAQAQPTTLATVNSAHGLRPTLTRAIVVHGSTHTPLRAPLLYPSTPSAALEHRSLLAVTQGRPASMSYDQQRSTCGLAK